MRCFFIKNRHIAGVAELFSLSPEEARLEAYQLYLERVSLYDGFEVWAMASDDELENRFQEQHGAYLFREGKSRSVLEVKSPDISPAIYEARLRGYDRAKDETVNEPALPVKEVKDDGRLEVI
jgi:hypothetical protein